MAVKFTDEEIETLIKEAKPYDREALRPSKMKTRQGHKRSEMELVGAAGNVFVVKLRQSVFNHLDFSVILGVREPGTTTIFRLRRYNGKSHEHRNKLAGEKFYDFHIHQATEQYQAYGFDEETQAKITNRYSNLVGAINCMIDDCGFFEPDPSKLSLFP